MVYFILVFQPRPELRSHQRKLPTTRWENWKHPNDLMRNHSWPNKKEWPNFYINWTKFLHRTFENRSQFSNESSFSFRLKNFWEKNQKSLKLSPVNHVHIVYYNCIKVYCFLKFQHLGTPSISTSSSFR